MLKGDVNTNVSTRKVLLNVYVTWVTDCPPMEEAATEVCASLLKKFFIRLSLRFVRNPVGNTKTQKISGYI